MLSSIHGKLRIPAHGHHSETGYGGERESGSRFDLRLRLGSALIHVLRHNEVDVVLLNDAPPTLGREVVWHGIRVFCADPEMDRDFIRDVQLRAVDLELFLRRMQPILLEALAR